MDNRLPRHFEGIGVCSKAFNYHSDMIEYTDTKHRRQTFDLYLDRSYDDLLTTILFQSASDKCVTRCAKFGNGQHVGFHRPK